MPCNNYKVITTVALAGLLLLGLLQEGAAGDTTKPYWRDIQFHKIIRGKLGENTLIEMNIAQSYRGVKFKDVAEFNNNKKSYEILLELRRGNKEKAMREAQGFPLWARLISSKISGCRMLDMALAR